MAEHWVEAALRPKAKPAAIGFVGAALWKFVQWLQGVDFLLSVGNESVGTALQALLGPGGWVFLGICAMWWLAAATDKQMSAQRPGLLPVMVVTAIPAFALGAMLVAHNANEPDVFAGYQREGSSGCSAVLDTRQMLSYKGKYAIHLFCGPTDSSVDKQRDARAVVSKPFTITGGQVAISTRFTQEQASAFQEHGQTWFHVALIPEGHDLREIRTLRDVEINGGIVLEAGAAAGPNVRIADKSGAQGVDRVESIKP